MIPCLSSIPGLIFRPPEVAYNSNGLHDINEGAVIDGGNRFSQLGKFVPRSDGHQHILFGGCIGASGLDNRYAARVV